MANQTISLFLHSYIPVFIHSFFIKISAIGEIGGYYIAVTLRVLCGKNNPVKNNICGTLWSLWQNAFMQNKPKLHPAKSSQVLIVSSLTTQAASPRKAKNKPKTNPNEPNISVNPVILSNKSAKSRVIGSRFFQLDIGGRAFRISGMKIRYTTAKDSVYIQTTSENGQYWVREDADGGLHALAGAVPIARRRLQELIDEYPRTLLDRTYCFDVGAEKEFFEDAQRERFEGNIDTEPTVIFFLVKAGDRYAVGCSSEIIGVEIEE